MEAVQTFLHGPATPQTLETLLESVSLRTLCTTILTADNTQQQLECSEAVNRALGVDGFGEKYVVLSVLRYLKDPSNPEEKDFIEFLQLLTKQYNVDIRYNVYSRLLPAFCQAISIAASVAQQNDIALDWSIVDQNVVQLILLPLFDSVETILSEMVARSIVGAFDGRMLTIQISARAFVDAWNLNTGAEEAVHSYIKAWRLKQPRGKLGFELTQLIEQLEIRLRGELDLKTKPAEDFEKDTVRVRAASLLIKLTDCTEWLQERCVDQDWYSTIMKDIFYSDDLLLRLSAAQLIIEEIVHTQTGLEYIFEKGWHTRLASGINSPENANNVTLNMALLRVLANIYADVPESREDILELDRSRFLSRIKAALAAPRSSPDFDLQRTTAISCIGCTAAALNSTGLAALAEAMPEWMNDLEWCLKHGSEPELLATLSALLRIFKGASGSAESIATLEEIFVPAVLNVLLEKGFPLQTELSYRVLLEMVQIGFRSPVAAFCDRTDLQRQLFVPLHSDPPAIKYSKHDFVQVVVAAHMGMLDRCGSKRVRAAFLAYASGNPFVMPPQYKDDSVAVADEAAV